jgi:hypothetical protein
MKFHSHASIKGFAVVMLTVFISACEVETLEDPNNADPNRIGAAASLSDLQNLADGTEAGMRQDLHFYFDDVSMIGREYYRFSTSDPRFTSDLLGKESAVLDNNTFYITNPYAGRYRVIKNANILINALTNTTAPSVTQDQRKAGIAYAKTIQAYQFLLVFNLLYNNGIRIDVNDPDNLGPFLTKQQSLDAIMNLLNEANADLKNNTADLPFNITIYSRKASEFAKFSRALAARVAIYKEDWAAADAALTESFLNLNGDLNTGAYHLYSAAGNDLLNPMFFPITSSGETRVTHPSFITDAQPGDKRLSKAPPRANEFQDGLQSNYHFFLYKTNLDPIPIIRNEELILIYAEVKAQTGAITEAVNAINRIRNSAGLSNYSGPTDKASLITEIIRQRRYSLFGEGHRWIDLRRYGLISQLPIDRPQDNVWEQFPIPSNE